MKNIKVREVHTKLLNTLLRKFLLLYFTFEYNNAPKYSFYIQFMFKDQEDSSLN